jgi:hypothetical protein
MQTIVPILMKITGIALNILISLYGCIVFLFGAFAAIFGCFLTPDGGTPYSIANHFWGIVVLIYGCIYLIPVMAFSQRSLIFGYAIAALIATIINLALSMPAQIVLSLLACQLILAGIAFINLR